jgi:hypothetical protein
MGFSGLAAGGAQDALMQLLAQRRLEEQMAQQAEAQRVQQELQRASLEQRQREHGDELGLRREQMGQQQEQFDATRRERSNVEGLRQRNVDREAWERENAPPAPDPLVEYEGRKRIDAKYREPREPKAPERDPIADYEARKQIDAKYAMANPMGPSPYSAERTQRTLQSVDELMGKVSRWTTGVGSALAMIPETDARNFRAELDTLKANIAFNELTEMREASKTGGALGQVSNIELGLLQSALGALDAGQSPENLKQQLQKIKESVSRFNAAKSGGVAQPPMQEPQMGRTGAEAPAPRRLRFDAQGNPIP